MVEAGVTKLTATLTNPSLDSSITTRLRLTSGNLLEGRGQVLTHEDMTARNTFDHPEAIKILPLSVNIRSNAAEVTLPPRSVAALELRIT